MSNFANLYFRFMNNNSTNNSVECDKREGDLTAKGDRLRHCCLYIIFCRLQFYRDSSVRAQIEEKKNQSKKYVYSWRQSFSNMFFLIISINFTKLETGKKKKYAFCNQALNNSFFNWAFRTLNSSYVETFWIPSNRNFLEAHSKAFVEDFWERSFCN